MEVPPFMDELERRIRLANTGQVHRETALSERAENELSILTGRSAATGALGLRRRRRYVRSLLTGMVAALVLGTLLVAGNVAFRPAAGLALVPLLNETPIDGSSRDILEQLIVSARQSAGAGVPPKRGAANETWAASNIVTDEPEAEVFVQPQEVEREWTADLSGRIVARAGEVKWGSETTDHPAEKPGTVLSDGRYEPGQYPAVFSETPPESAAELRGYLASHLGLGSETTSGEWFKAIQDLRVDWTLTGEQNAAILEIIRDLPDVTVAGSVRDRLGREGIAVQTETRADGHFRDVLVFEAGTGVLISAEDIYLGALDEVSLPAMTVLNYTAWKDAQ
jgi:hypothetical protein